MFQSYYKLADKARTNQKKEEKNQGNNMDPIGKEKEEKKKKKKSNCLTFLGAIAIVSPELIFSWFYRVTKCPLCLKPFIARHRGILCLMISTNQDDQSPCQSHSENVSDPLADTVHPKQSPKRTLRIMHIAQDGARPKNIKPTSSSSSNGFRIETKRY